MKFVVATVVILATCCLSAVDAAASSFDFVARHYFPAGYRAGTTEGVPDQYGFGFGALERSYYDADQMLLYGGSEIGFVTISDFANYPETVKTLDISFPLEDSLTDIKICGDYLLFTTKDDPNPGLMHVYSKAMRDNETESGFTAPSLVQSIEVGVGPDHILVSKDCMIVATANEGEGDYDDVNGLVNPVGSVSIVRGPLGDADATTHELVSLNTWTEDELLEKGVHLPLSLNAMQYWSVELGLNFDNAIENYTPDMGLEPEYLAFSADESQIFVNLQENNAVVIVDVANNMATDIYPYGLKTDVPADILEDGGCNNMPTTAGLYFLRSVDGITAFEKDGVQYIITANEGDDVEYGDFGEKLDGGDIFDNNKILFFGMTAGPSIFDPSDVTAGTAAFFNAACDDTVTEYCSPGLAFSVGSSMVDYSDPTAPNIYRLTGIGGRGITIYKLDSELGLELVWDSGDSFEREGCVAYPWAHNSVADEEFAPVGRAFYNSLDEGDDLRIAIEELNNPAADGCEDDGGGLPGACPMSEMIDDRSTSDGCAPETVVVGEACGTFYTVTVCEKNSIGFVYDLTDVSAPTLFQVFHLSEVSETLSPGLGYDMRTLGEIDSETIQFLTEEESPTGNAAVLFSGAFSGTTSLWEFKCTDTDDEVSSGEESSALFVALTAPFFVSLGAILASLC